MVTILKENNFFLSSLELLGQKMVSSSLWGFIFSSGCCYNKFKHLPRKVSIPIETDPRKADLLIISGAVNNKSAPILRSIYEQMAYPKWVIAIGDCACGKSIFMNTYAISGGAEEFIPIDIKIPGCPPTEEEISKALTALKKGKKNAF